MNSKKTFVSLATFLFASTAFSNNLIKHIDSTIHGQTYCIKGKESKEIKYFLKKYTEYAYNECKHEKYNDKDFDSLKELEEKDPKKYSFYLGFAYYVGWTPSSKINDEKARKLFKKASSYGNVEAQIRYCNLIETKGDKIRCYNKLTSPESYFARAIYIYNDNAKLKSKYIKEASDNGSLEAYILYIGDLQSKDEDFEINKIMAKKLQSIGYNKKTSITSKFFSADLLGDETTVNLLAQIPIAR